MATCIIAWAGPKGIVFDKSTDGGWTFGKDVLVSATPGGWDLPVPGLERHNGMPVTAVDLSDGPRKGTIYVNWIDERNGDLDVFVAASSDSGARGHRQCASTTMPKGRRRCSRGWRSTQWMVR